MNQLADAYKRIIKVYSSEGFTPEPLEWIGYSGRWTVVFGSRKQNGMAFNFSGEHEFYGHVDPSLLAGLKAFVGQSLTCLADYLIEKEGILYEALLLAVLNALSSPLNNKGRLEKMGVSYSHTTDFNFVKMDDFVTVIGAGYVVNQLRDCCKEVHVSDMRSKSVIESFFVGKETKKGPDNIVLHSFEESSALLSQSDIVLITGCTLSNQTIFSLLPMIKKARVIGLYGPSAMLCADYLLDLGVNFITTSRIIDPVMMKKHLYDGFCGNKFEECLERYSIIKN